MGYFSNGTEGMVYEEKYCNHCLHRPFHVEDGCPVWDMHTMFNADQASDSNIRFLLDMFIPRDEAGLNQECVMFVHEDDVEA